MVLLPRRVAPSATAPDRARGAPGAGGKTLSRHPGPSSSGASRPWTFRDAVGEDTTAQGRGLVLFLEGSGRAADTHTFLPRLCCFFSSPGPLTPRQPVFL